MENTDTTWGLFTSAELADYLDALLDEREPVNQAIDEIEWVSDARQKAPEVNL